MSPQGERALTSTIDCLYAAAMDDHAWPEVMIGISRVFDSPRAAIIRTSVTANEVLDIKSINFDEETKALYERYYWKLDPTLAVSRGAKEGTWNDGSFVLDPRTTSHREYVHDYALRRGLRWVAGGKVHQTDQNCIFVSVQRPADANPFERDSAEIFDRLNPHIRRACLISEELQSARRQAVLGTSAVNGLRQAAFVLSSTGVVLFANASGEARLRAGMPFIFRGGRARLPGADSQLRLTTALAGATSPSLRRAAGWTHLVSRSSQWLIRVAPLHELPHCALVYVSPVESSPIPVNLLQTMFGMTRSEAEIASALAKGNVIKEIAFDRGVSELTVRAQVRSIMSKTGARRLAGVQALLNAIPPLASDGKEGDGEGHRQFTAERGLMRASEPS